MRATVFFFASLIAAAWGYAENLDGKSIELTGGKQASVNVPITLPFEGAAPTGKVVVEQAGKSLPATVRNGELVFIPEAAAPGAKQKYTVKVLKEKSTEKVQITPGKEADTLVVSIDGVEFTTYHYGKELKKPFLWPVLSDGVGVTRDYPMGPVEKKADHPHHRSMWTSYGNVNGADCWAEGEKSGYQRVEEVTHGSGDAYGWIHSKDTWTTVDGKPVVAEEREYRFYASSPQARIFDETVTFTAAHGDALFKDTKEGGIFALRIRDVMNEENGGTITLSEGRTGQLNCWGKKSPWCDYSGTVPDKGVHGVTVMDNPANLRYPTNWHVRGYGLLGANPFGLNDFTNKAENGDWTLKSGEKQTFKYRIYVHTGDMKESKVEDRYADYITPPQVAWAK
jgi:hypothetical protein